MNKYKLNYELAMHSITEKIISVKLSVTNTNNRFFKLYKGKINFLDFKCNELFNEDTHYYNIENPNDTLVISYKIKIGTPGKHGFYGHISNDLIVFAGEQFLLLPFEVLTCDSRQISPDVSNITINYNFPGNFNAIVPFKQSNFTTLTSSCSSPKWSNIYELMKSSYSFGNFSTYEYTDSNNMLSIYVDTDINNIETETLDEINKLFVYYNKLFNYMPHNLSIILLSNPQGDGILGGCGRTIISSSFDKNNLRDWQLLSHRMLHSFMDTALPLSDFHTPPTLWLTEGLATYYENIALESLSDNFKEKLLIDSSSEFRKLFDRYLYTVLKDPHNFSFPPMEEINISSAGKIEFLHYTQAPLIIKLIEDMCSNNSKREVILNELLKLDISKDFSLQELFTNVLGDKLDTFAMNYLFNNQLLHLWYLNNSSEKEEEIIDDLNYFEYVLYTWMALEDYYYTQDNLSLNGLSTLSDLATSHKIYFNSPMVESQVKNYSPTIYKLLKQYALRARVCNINYFDINLRYTLLNNENNLRIWQDFISKYI